MPAPPPLLAYPILLFPRTLQESLDRVARAGVVERVPNLWQLSQGVLRMWHRVLFRSETVGMSRDNPVRKTWRARMLQYRPVRFPFLLAEKAVFPLDLTGLVSSQERLICHLLGAHHDRHEFVYDLEILDTRPGAMKELRFRTREIVEFDSPRSRWMRDLVVFEGYHERLLAVVDEAVRGGVRVPESLVGDPDYSFRAYLDWCARQPETPARTLEALVAGDYTFADGLRPAEGTAPGPLDPSGSAPRRSNGKAAVA